MKTIVRKSGNVSTFLLPDDADVDLSGVDIQVTGAANFTISPQACAPSEADVHENVTAGDVLVGTSTKITDWIGNKFTFNGTAWGSNAAWEEIRLPCTITEDCDGVFLPPSKVCGECGETNG
jgi:hypothetical protein